MGTILYKSTRDEQNVVTASQAILKGLADDGGLYVPTEQPNLALDFNEIKEWSYQQTALKILSAYYTDFTQEELTACIEAAYDHKFDTETIAPVVQKGNDFYLELFHGPTIAFKDLALSILPYLMTTAAKKNQLANELVILTATSGDTGKAAMAGFADVPGTKIIVFYPKEGVSEIQERQMRTQVGENTYVVAVEGNFDDAQSQVKTLFNDLALRQELAEQNQQFSSANSINIGRLIPQVVYYVYAYAQLVKSGKLTVGQPLNVSVPTGNFGNILAAHYAKQLGVPLNTLICASNPNNVLTDFFTTGTYDRNRPFYVTSSPSMDILISSNLERLLYEITDNDVHITTDKMQHLQADGQYEIDAEMKEHLADFYAGYATIEQTAETIQAVFNQTGYVLDPHTAVAKKVAAAYQEATEDQATPMLIVSTASPYKFPEAVVTAIDNRQSTRTAFEWLTALHNQTNLPIPTAVVDLFEAPIRHNRLIQVSEMKACVKSILAQ